MYVYTCYHHTVTTQNCLPELIPGLLTPFFLFFCLMLLSLHRVFRSLFSYQIFKDQTQTQRVVEVTGNAREPISLDNDDVLRRRDMICMLDEWIVNDKNVEAHKGDKNYVKAKDGSGYVIGIFAIFVILYFS